MAVECLALKDLTSPRRSFVVDSEEDGGHGELKENLYTERRKSTPLKTSESAIPVLLMNRKGLTSDLAQATPIKHTAAAEPWTPTANLKMLISAAGPDIRVREMKKVLFRPIQNHAEQPASAYAAAEDTEEDRGRDQDQGQDRDQGQFEAVDEEEEDAEKKPSRKQKSLGLLCQKFLALYPDDPPPQTPIWISLDEVATSLGVERRRIYDIVNVLESLAIVGRIAKNSYTWYGRQRLRATLEDLQQRGREQGYHLQMDLASAGRGPGGGRGDGGGEGEACSAGTNRKDKSLRIMSQKFVMLFLVSKTQTVTLDAAAKILIEESQDCSSHSKYKTKVRRLYDIANVLTSLGLIKKVHVREERGRKPAFKWLGPVEFSSRDAQPENTLHGAPAEPPRGEVPPPAGFSIPPPPAVVQQPLIRPAPGDRHHDLTGLQNQAADYSSRTLSSITPCPLRSGNGASNASPPFPITQSFGGCLPPSSTHPPLLTGQPPPEHLFVPPPHCLAYLPSLSQPSVVTLYRVSDRPERVPEGQTAASLEAGGKRRREGGEEESWGRKRRSSRLEEWDEIRAESLRADARTVSSEQWAPEGHGVIGGGGGGGEHVQPSHYLYVPNNAGFNSFNFLISAGQPPASIALPQSGVPAVAVPYVLVPSPALSHYPLVAESVQRQSPDNPHKLGFGLPAVMSPTQFVVGAPPYGLATASEVSGPPVPEQRTPRSPPGPGRMVGPDAPQPEPEPEPEPVTPRTPKETPTSSSNAFFQTPGTLGSAAGTEPAARRRASAQRRLDVGHSAAV